jgi:putative ABC transport system ATP-binding protein
VALPLSQPLAPAAEPAHSDHHVHPWKRLRAWIALERSEINVVIIYSLIVGLLSLVIPVATQLLVNTISFGMLLQPLVLLTAVVMVGLCFSALMQYLRKVVVEGIQRRLFVRVSADSLHRLLRVRMEAFDHHHGPELVNRFFDVVTVQKSFSTLLLDGLTLLMTTLAGMLLLAAYHPLLLAFSVVLCISIVVILFPLGFGAVDSAMRESKTKYAVAAWLEEIARHPITFKTTGGASLAISRTNELVQKYLDYRQKHFKILMRQVAGSLLLQAIATSLLLGVGGWLVMGERLTLGQLIAAELIVSGTVSGLSKFGKQLETWYDLLAAVDKLGYLTDLPLERGSGEAVPARSSGASIHLRNVSFAYPGRQWIFDQTDAEITSGSRTGILAPSGEGKSTLADLLAGFRLPLYGHIEFNGQDLRSVDMTQVRSRCHVLRGPEVFEGSVLENVKLGTSATAAEVSQALTRAGLLEEVMRFPEGLQTRLSTGGLPLSQGQVLRLMLARMYCARPEVVILDELLDQIVDTRERDCVLSELFSKENNWTLVMISQLPSVLTRCDAFYRLQGGKLVKEDSWQ